MFICSGYNWLSKTQERFSPPAICQQFTLLYKFLDMIFYLQYY